MDFKYHLEKAWHSTLQHLVPLIFMTLVMAVLGFLTLGILAPVLMAGYMQSVLLMLREEREPKIQDLFSQMRLFLPLLGFSAAVFVAVMIGFMLLVIPGLAVAAFVSFACIYLIPLMTDKELGLIDAVKESWKMATGDNLLEHIIVVILFLGIGAIGGSVFIGWLFTQPFATVFLLSIYLQRTGRGAAPQPPPQPVP